MKKQTSYFLATILSILLFKGHLWAYRNVTLKRQEIPNNIGRLGLEPWAI